MIKGKMILMVGLAIFVSLMVTALILQKMPKQPKTAPSNIQSAAVTIVDLPWGAVLNKQMIKMVNFLKESLPSGTFNDISALEGRTIVYPVKEGELILESKLAPKTMETGGVAAVVGVKKRAIAVKVDRVIGVSGFIHPGHRVDVLVTLREQKKESSPITKTVLENILVLATGVEVEKPAGKMERAAHVDVITLEVTPEEAERLTLAATEGRLQLVLRNSIDTENVYTKGMTIPALLAAYRDQNPPKVKRYKSQKPSPAKGKTKDYTVEFIKGNQKNELKFKQGGGI